MTSADHVDAMTYGIAVGLVDERGKDPDWVRMVMQAKGHGDVDIDAARVWLAANPGGCVCEWCRSQRAKWTKQAAAARRPRPAQMTLF